jgi:hypothetical protein
MTPIRNHHCTTFQTPAAPAGFKLQAYDFNTDTKMTRMLAALSGAATPRSKVKKTHKASAPRRFSWEAGQ